MTGTFRQRLIPACAALIGMLTILILTPLMKPSDPQLEAAIQRFDGLDYLEQEDLRAKAEGFLSRPVEDQQRLQAIHTAVQEQPELQQKLQQLHSWWQTLKPGERSQLRDSSGVFTADWTDRVQSEWTSRSQQANLITIHLPQWPPRPPGNERSENELVFSVQQVDLVLNAVIPEPPPAELAERLNAFSKPGQVTERRMQKLIWVLQQVHPGQGLTGNEKPSAVTPEAVNQAIDDYLVDSPTRQKISELFSDARMMELNRFLPFGGDNRAAENLGRLKAAVSATFFLRSTLEQLYISLRQTFSQDVQTELVDVFADDLSRERQIELMSEDPSDFSRELRDAVFTKRNAESPEMARLVSDTQAILSRDRRMPFRGGVDGRRGDPRGGRAGFGDRGRDNPPPREGGPPQDERPPLDRPPREKQRP